ncbi:hypothetical protein AB4Y86_10755 [Arthrobacter sp. 2YAF22_2]
MPVTGGVWLAVERLGVMTVLTGSSPALRISGSGQELKPAGSNRPELL